MSLTKDRLKKLRAIGHKLNPVVIVTSTPNDNVRSEIDRALDDHELIKIKIAIADREEKLSVIEQICDSHQADLVQSIGNVALILRETKKPNPRLSNLLRHV